MSKNEARLEVRLPAELKEAAQRYGKEEGVTLSVVVRRVLEMYVQGELDWQPPIGAPSRQDFLELGQDLADLRGALRECDDALQRILGRYHIEGLWPWEVTLQCILKRRLREGW